LIIELQRGGHIQRMVYDDFELRIRNGEIPPDLMIRFEAVTGDEFVPVGQLELYQVLADPQRQDFRRKLTTSGVPLMTAILVGVQIRIYLASWAPGIEDFLQTAFTNWAPGVLEQAQVYRLLTYGLLHISFTHLLFNLTFLAYTGYNLERALGRLNLFILYFGSVFAGGVLSMWMAPERPSLGASGGDFGLIAAAVVFGWKHWDDIPTQARAKFGWALAPYLGFSLISGLSAENVDNWGHLGGLIGGAFLMTLLAPETAVERIRRNRWVRRITVIGCLCVSIIFGVWGPSLISMTTRGEGSWTVPVPSYWREGWTFTGDRGWFSPTGEATMVVTRTVQDRPLSDAAAVDKLVDRIAAAGHEPQVLERTPIEVAGHEGTLLVIQFSLAGELQELRSVVLTRGVVTYRTHLQSSAQRASHYEPVLQRALAAAQLDVPEELTAAYERAETHPRSWQPAVELADALYRTGEPVEALSEYERALSFSPLQTQALVGRLRVYAFYGLDGGLLVAQESVALASADVRVLVAATDVFDSVGASNESIAVLNQAWTEMPGNGIIRRARLRRGLPVDN
jgi:rhomboid protease GluP